MRHLQKLNFCEEVKLACTPIDIAFIHPVDMSEVRMKNDLYTKTWKMPEKLDYNEVNSRLAKTFGALKSLQLEVKELEKKLHQYDW